jgi:hypothetical protein
MSLHVNVWVCVVSTACQVGLLQQFKYSLVIELVIEDLG